MKKRENRITFEIKIVYCLELLPQKAMKFLGSTKNIITKHKTYEDTSHLEIAEEVWRVLYKFVPNRLFGHLSDISPKNIILLKKPNSEFSDIEEWFTNKISKLLEIK